ncbi:cell division protein FtsZ, partial [Candidatus Beckwithbacteria bacterium]|nr:cell division protein FtsZ [Candidatus Beckwithbacteria bacterium]
PLLEISIQGAKGILFNISGGKDLTMKDVNDAAEIISKTADGDANIIFGTSIDEALNDQIKITVIATGFEGSDRFPRFSTPTIVRPQNLQEIPSRSNIGSAQGVNDDTTLQSDDDLVEPRQDIEKMSQPLPPQQEMETDLIDDDDPFEIPAFLRQKK